MNIAAIVGLITAITALVAALGTFLAQIGHLMEHRALDKQAQQQGRGSDKAGVQ